MKSCPHSNDSPEAMFWSEHLKWAQWTAQLVTFRITKVISFKRPPCSRMKGYQGRRVVSDHKWPLTLDLKVSFVGAPSLWPSSGARHCWPLHFNSDTHFSRICLTHLNTTETKLEQIAAVELTKHLLECNMWLECNLEFWDHFRGRNHQRLLTLHQQCLSGALRGQLLWPQKALEPNGCITKMECASVEQFCFFPRVSSA